MLAPITGAWLSLTGTLAALALAKLSVFALSGTLPLVTTGIPTVAATLYWHASHTNKKVFSFILAVIIPGLCIGLFSAHAGPGWPYALYWLIPISLHLFTRNTILTRALISTFIAHALGSLIWSYTMPIHGTEWIALIPVVAVERMTMATGMVLAYKFTTMRNWSTLVGYVENIIKGTGLYAAYRNDHGRQSSLGTEK